MTIQQFAGLVVEHGQVATNHAAPWRDPQDALAICLVERPEQFLKCEQAAEDRGKLLRIVERLAGALVALARRPEEKACPPQQTLIRCRGGQDSEDVAEEHLRAVTAVLHGRSGLLRPEPGRRPPTDRAGQRFKRATTGGVLGEG
jgi:hypothetical protein